MRTRWLSLLTTATLCTLPLVVNAAERHSEFVQGLRNKEYFDYAVFYLDQMQADPTTPDEIRQTIPYEKALTLLGSVRIIKNAADKNNALEQALAFLDQFVKDNPRHDLAGQANTQRGHILLGRAKVEIWQSRSPSNQEGRGEFQERAQDFIAKARAIFQKAHDQHDAALQSFGSFIDQEEEPKKFETRRIAEERFIRVQLDLGLCGYWNGQTYDRGSDDYQKALTKASLEFEDMHSRYRTQGGGLLARTWQGKCFEEQDDINKALGIYNELLDHSGRSDLMRSLQDQARHFRLICLNHDKRKDYQLAILEAKQWLGQNRSRSRTQVGLAIRWERARAVEAIAESQRDLTPSDRERLLRDALDDVKFINRYPGQYNDLSLFKLRQLMTMLNKGDQDPRDFASAIGIARDMVTKQIKQKRAAIDTAKKTGKTSKEVAEVTRIYKDHLNESVRILQLASSLVETDTLIYEVNEARYLLSYVHYLKRMNYESAILGEFIATHYRKGDGSQLAQDAAYLSMAAYIQAFNDSPPLEQEIDMWQIERMAKLITENWPNTDRANDARMQMASVYSQRKQQADAAKWYESIPESAPHYTQAQLQAGQSYWAAYLEAPELPAEEKPSRAELEQWHNSAEKRLLNGIEKTQKVIPSTGAAPDDLIAGKLSLAYIHVGQGEYKESIDLLTEDPHAVIGAINISDESQRPPEGIKSLAFTSAVYQALLRSYVGNQDLDKARETMQSLERVVAGAGGGGEALTEIYKDLGRALEQELKLLKAAGDETRCAEVRSSFEKFLGQMYERKDQTYNSLVWIAETYFGLGQGTADDRNQAAQYFQKAATTYQTILDRIGNGSLQGIDPRHLTVVKLRMVTCKREEGNFEQAIQFLTKLLAEKPKSLNVQIEAARVLQSWAASGQGDSWKKFRDAIVGIKLEDKALVWGWANLALRLQRLLEQGGLDQKSTGQYKQMGLDARYNCSDCRHQFGIAQSSTKKKTAELEKAKLEILAFAAICGDIDLDWWEKFDRLYQQVQVDLNDTPVALVKPKRRPHKAKATTAAITQQETAKKRVARRDEPQESNWSMVVFATILFAGGGIGIFFMVKSQSKRPKAAYAASLPATLTMPNRTTGTESWRGRARRGRPNPPQQSPPQKK